MIKSITFKTNSPFENSTKKIEFGRINIIIGPKGGGKSTLFDLLTNLENKEIFSSVKDAFKSHNLTISNIEIDGESMNCNSLQEIKIGKQSERDKNAHWSNKNNVIFQDDPIKKNLSSTTEMDKQKQDFAKEITSENQDVIKYISKINDFYNSVYTVVDKDKSSVVYWDNLFEINDNAKSLNEIIFNIDSSFSEFSKIEIQKIEHAKTFLTKFNEENNSRQQKYKLTADVLNNYYISKEYKKEFEDKIRVVINHLKQLETITNSELDKLNVMKKVTSTFKNSLKKLVNELKSKISTDKIASFVTSSKNHFREMSITLKNLDKSFYEIIKQNIDFNIDMKKSVNNMLDLSIKREIKMTDEQKYDVLKIVLYTTKKVQDDVSNWVIAAKDRQGERKPFDSQKIVKHIAREIIKDEIIVLADGKNYDKLSLGQRSIYGIKYKLDRSIGQMIFMDQPEDNLDNNTIASNLLSWINNMKDEQIFIVTHNANIGILTHPDRVIVARMEQEESKQNINQYEVGVLKNDGTDLSADHYLEGGIKYIENRLNIIKGEKNEITN